MDFVVRTVQKTETPNKVVYTAMRQCHSDELTSIDSAPDERRCGALIVKHLLKGDKGHFGVLEHPSIVLQCGYFPHSVMQQARTHRVGISFDVSSFRNVSTKLLQVADGKIDIEDVIYFRPLGKYVDHKGAKYEYTDAMRVDDRVKAIEAVRHYANRLASGMSEEHARGMLPFDYRQNFVVSFNCRSLMHFLDLRAKKDAQLEIQQMAELMMVEFRKWMPEVAAWYEENRWGKARLSP